MARGVDALSASRGAHRPGSVASVRLPWWTGAALAGTTVAVLVLVPFAALVREAGTLPFARVASDPWLRRVVAFSFTQAALSTLLSVGLALPVALALSHERRFPGRRALVSLFGLSLVLPAVVAVYGIVAVWGGRGWVNAALEPLTGLAVPPLYGLGGILLAHVFFNLPLSTRVLLQALDGVPESHWRLAAQLGMPLSARLRHIEWPAMARQVPGLATLVFTLCFTSFAIVMTLGGGPRATTVEVAIYQALRFDFDVPLAVALAVVQLVLCLGLTALGALAGPGRDAGGAGPAAARALPAWHPNAHRSAAHRALDRLCIAAVALLVLPPLAALLLSGVNGRTLATLGDGITLLALGNTVVAALAASALSVTLALGLLGGARHLHARLGMARAGDALQSVGNAILVLPPIVLGTGLFLALRAHADVFSLALVLVVLVNALAALPFALRILSGPALRGAAARDRLVRSLGMSRLQRWRIVDWPLMRRPLGLAAAVAATLTAGDLGAIALFGSERVTTLPLLLHTRLGSYRLEEAAVTAALLLVLCIALFAALQRLVGGPSTAHRTAGNEGDPDDGPGALADGVDPAAAVAAAR